MNNQYKAFFMMINLIISVIALSVLVSGADNTAPEPPETSNTKTDTTTKTTDTKDTKTNTVTTGNNQDVKLDGTEGVINVGDANSELNQGTTTDSGPNNNQGVVDVNVDSSNNYLTNMFKFNLHDMVWKAGLGASIFGTLGSMSGGDNGALYGTLAGVVGGIVASLTRQWLGENGSLLLGLSVAIVIFILTWRKMVNEVVEFHCMPWQAPIGGGDCEICNEFEECGEYTCKSLGQACEIINAGTEEQKCAWLNPHDVNSPKIEMIEVNKGHKFIPDTSIRPPATGVIITQENKECIKAFFPLKFKFITNEPAQCKVDYALTTSYDEMNYFVAGSNLFQYNHTEELSLPGPDAINDIAPELKNDGEYSLFVRCMDANGNFNQDAYSVSFCVEKGPDTTPPAIMDVNIPSGNPIQYNQTSLDLEVYVNEPSECRWSFEDRAYENMAYDMECSKNLWEMNHQNVYTCKTELTGVKDRAENLYYFRCKDQPYAEEGDRNVNVQSYLYKVIGTQALNILSAEPDEKTISGSTNIIHVDLEVITDNGYKNGEATCYYSDKEPQSDTDYIRFLDTGEMNKHIQRQDLPQGDYTYYFKCVDLGGNVDYGSTSFTVISDRQGPVVVRAYKESGELKIITSEASKCGFSNIDCNFEIDDAVMMDSFDDMSHTSTWQVNKNHYIRCKDEYNNQPNSNICSIIVRPTKTSEESDILEIGDDFVWE